jgi:hypothetical protein
MNQHKQAVWRGLAVGVGFVGVWGMAIDGNAWPVSVVLVSVSIVLWMIGDKHG